MSDIKIIELGHKNDIYDVPLDFIGIITSENGLKLWSFGSDGNKYNQYSSLEWAISYFKNSDPDLAVKLLWYI